MNRRTIFLFASFMLFNTLAQAQTVQADAPASDKSGVEWIFVKGGIFQMGDTFGGGDSDEKPVHTVTLKDFYMAKTEVTNAQYAAFLNAYGSDKVKSGEYAGQMMIYEHDWGVKKISGQWRPAPGYENYSVVWVTWFGANEFCRFYGLRLPTEAEWEYAARGGSKSRNTPYSGSAKEADDVAWYYDNSGGRTHTVATKAANEIGIFDMSGNVWEWCWDWYGGYGSGALTDPAGPFLRTVPRSPRRFLGRQCEALPRIVPPRERSCRLVQRRRVSSCQE